MFFGFFLVVSYVFRGCLSDVSQVFAECFLAVCRGFLRGVFWDFLLCFSGASETFHLCFLEVSW